MAPDSWGSPGALLQVLGTVERLHAAGFIHRDISSGNMMFSSEDRIKLGDMGSANVIHGPDDTLTTSCYTSSRVGTRGW